MEELREITARRLDAQATKPLRKIRKLGNLSKKQYRASVSNLN
jgi:hypothetical protein